jgi:2',3'-cyclic-nucleotide 2'-phosphodiesterase (5'-nucleotidase family)
MEVKMTKKFFTIVSLFLFLLFVPGLFFAEELTILHTNDTHSHIYPFGPNDSYGGIDRMSTMIKLLQKNNKGSVLTLNAGDVFVGTFAFNKYLGYPELKIMEGLYDAMCLGNHEFDLGIDALTGILSGAIAEESPVTLPILCANIDWSILGENHPLKDFVKPYMVMFIGGLKVGLIGVVETNEYDYSSDVLKILTNPYEAAGYWADILKNQEKCKIVICLSHLGKMSDVMGLSQVPGIDIIVGGHSHDALFEPIQEGGKIIVQAGEFGMYLGELKVYVGNGGVKLINYKLHPINRMVKKDPTLLRTLLSLRIGILRDPRFGPVYEKAIAIALRNLEERWEEGNPYRDTALGNLVTDAIRKGVKSRGHRVDIALEANGYIATRIYRGKVVGNDILRAVPYGYDPESGLGFKIKVIQLYGYQILAGLEFSVFYVDLMDDLSMQASGLTFEYDSSKTAGSRIDPTSVEINGNPINPYGLYWVALNEQLVLFMKSLLESLNMGPIFNSEFDPPYPYLFEYNLVRDYAHKLKLLNYRSEGRIIDTAALPKLKKR